MNKFTTILVFLSLFSAIYALSDTELVQVKSNPFGSALNNLLEMHMLSQDPSGRLNEINNVLDQVEELLTKQNQDSEQWINGRKAQCSNDQDQLQQQIKSVHDSLESDKETTRQHYEEQKNKQGDLDNERSNLSTSEESLRNARNSLEDQTKRYELAHADYQEAIKACKEALELLATLRQSSFIQAKTQSRLVTVTALIQKHVPAKTSAFVQPIVSVLTELSTSNKVDQDKLKRIVSLIEQLLEELQKQLGQLESSNIITVEDLNSLIKKTEESIENSKGQIKSLEARLEELKNLIENLNGAISSNESTHELLKDALNILKRLRVHFHEKIVSSVENIEKDTYYDELHRFD
ncbi:hypothetical protein IMG5_097470 [Ichthyophthirius multifiliis]|uniref:Uncharacterized protein n=1 Tax=Ichthyophthirius multifiliis TaxID=5932 RepID=G0QRT6_ICHMU|nr:hypothetical protein IMG5_097470 [Ichthyophthirius multifiliis]EGR32070.1 hypothetical protein IMG5_097470 [Ichthyophthirius multifiliis]|eukprot:XP_004035556.1 hypothetical protein IMG5_097470 [Ichthyophthirius multifiliis]